MSIPLTLVVIGGGAAGFFGAITAKKINPRNTVILLEKSAQLLSKVRVSGGGRCNVTHSCFEPNKLILNYPRGEKELLGPFNRFQPRDTIQWFESRGVILKTESDGRIFPTSNDSQTIIDCLLIEAQKLGVEIRLKQRLEKITKSDKEFKLEFNSGDSLIADRLLLATGSSPQGFQFAQSFGHTIQETVPSLFTFNIPSSPLNDLAGISVGHVEISLPETQFVQSGPLLITHWGFSGPAALKLSAWAARYLHQQNYKVKISVDWIPDTTKETLLTTLQKLRSLHPTKSLTNENPFQIPKNLWKRLLEICKLADKKRLSEFSNVEFIRLSDLLKANIYNVDGRTTNKEEFVTCGGVTLKEVNFKTMESRTCPGLFFAGEILDIDAVTGGFNFQNAWTTGWIAGNAMSI